MMAAGLAKTGPERGAHNAFVWRSNRIRYLIRSGSSALRMAARLAAYATPLLSKLDGPEWREIDAQLTVGLQAAAALIARADRHAGWTLSAITAEFPLSLSTDWPAHLDRPAGAVLADQAAWQAWCDIPKEPGMETARDEMDALRQQAAFLAGFLRGERGWFQRELAELEHGPQAQPKAAGEAERMRRMRARRKAGIVHKVTLDLHQHLVAELERHGFIKAAHSPQDLEAGVSSFLSAALAAYAAADPVADNYRSAEE